MVDARKIADDLECRRYQAKLVDLADGVLGDPETGRLEDHLRTCSLCSAALVALSEVPSVLQQAGSVPHDEEFWSQQRDDIMGQIRQQQTSSGTRRPALFWAAGLAAAAALVLTVVGYQTLREYQLPLVQTSASLAQLDEESVAELTDLMDLYVPESRFMSMDIASDRAPGHLETPEKQSTEGELREFSEDDLERLNHILGELG